MPDVYPLLKEKRNDLKLSQSSIMSTIVNFQSVYINSGIEKELFDTEFSSKLNTLNLLVLCLFGQFDFVVPPALADDVLSKVKSNFKRKVISLHSGHDPYGTETSAFNKEVIQFVEQFK